MTKKKCIIGSLLVLTFCVLISDGYARELIIAGIENPPFRFYDEQKIPTGIDVDIIAHIMNSLGIEYRIIFEPSSTRLTDGWQKEPSRYDVVFTYSHNKEREESLWYPQESHLDIAWNFFIRKEDTGKFPYTNFEDLRELKIGATKDFAYTKEFWKASEDGVLQLEIVVKNELQMKMLRRGRIQTVPLNTFSALYQAKQEGYSQEITYLPKPLKSKPYYNTFVKSSDYPNLQELITLYDKALKAMKENGTLEAILAKYGYEKVQE